MFGKRRGNIKALFALGAALFIALAMACGGETIREVIKEVPVEVIVTQEVIKEVIKEVVVPGETIIKEVPVEVIVTQEVIKEVIKEVLVPGETIIKEVIKEVVVVQEVVKEIFTEVPFEKIVLKEIPQAPGITADNPPGSYSWPRYVPDFMPATFQEAPALAKLVALGELPPVEERLPTNPLVIEPAESIGKYGGTWFRAFTGPADGQNMERPLKDHMLFFDTGMTTPQPNIAASWTVNDDATEFTFTLRENMKWSDGAPFTTRDIMFWVDHMLLNEDINPTPPAWAVHGGELLKFEAIDDLTWKVTTVESYGLFIPLMASVIVAGPHTRGDSGDGGYAAAHYLEQFHPDFVGLDAANAQAEAAGFDNWTTYFLNRNHLNANPDAPSMMAWMVTESINTSRWVFERNPYYFAVDTAGNQLPYIDRVVLTLAEDLEVLNLRAIAGDFTVMGRHIDIAKLPIFLENAAAQNYRIQFWRQPESGIANLSFNESWNGDPELLGFAQMVEFRRALSLGIERDQINEVFFLSIGETTGLCRGFADPNNPGKYYGEDDVQLDPARANAILDSLGLDKKDSDGFRLLPSGNRVTIPINAIVASFEDLPGISEMIAQHWKKNLGINTQVNSTERSLATTRNINNETLVFIWESSGRDAVLITPTHLLAVASGISTDVLGMQWFDSGGAAGREPVSSFLR
ncbi:MAG: ABC transporter substrate-binding protein [Chloroflexi bacterium]|nr:ABC transporter substrate-binding protein [Chloroflexota bacterium]